MTSKVSEEHISPVISLQQIFILKGTVCEIMTSFRDILKPYLLDFNKGKPLKKTFELVKNQNNSSRFKKLVNNGVSVSVCEHKNKITVSVESLSFETIVNFENKVIEEVRCDVISSYVENTNVCSSFCFQVDPKISETIEVSSCINKYNFTSPLCI